MELTNKIKTAFTAAALWAVPYIASAQIKEIQSGLTTAGGAYASSKDRTLPQIIGGVISSGLSLLGVVLLVILIYGGVMWMMAGGDETKTKKARQSITNAVIGLIIVVAAYAIAGYVLTGLNAALGGTTGTPATP
jgi:hypothetical protein